jgi:hypothetical protein
MIDLNTARNMALALPGTVEMDHFGIPSFRVKDRIFSTLWIHDNKMMVKLSLIDQSVFSAFDSSVIYPVPNKYGPMGYTLLSTKQRRRKSAFNHRGFTACADKFILSDLWGKILLQATKKVQRCTAFLCCKKEFCTALFYFIMRQPHVIYQRAI